MTSDKLVGLHTAYSNSVFMAKRADVPVLGYLSPSLRNLHTDDGMVPFGQKAYKYKEKTYMPGRTTLNGALAAAAVSVTFAEKVFRPGDLAVLNDEVITLVSSDDYLTFVCTRSTFTGADAAHADGDVALLFGTSYVENSAAPTAGAISQATEVTTSTDVFIDTVQVSGSARYMQQYAEGNQDKMIQYTSECMDGMLQQLQTRYLFSDYQAASGETTAGRMDGAYERIAGSNYVNFSSADLTYPDIQKMYRMCKRKGGSPRALFISDYQGHIADQWIMAYGQVSASELAQAIFGSHVRAIRVGNDVLDIISTDIMQKLALMVTVENTGVGPKDASRVFHPEQLGKDGDRDKVMVVGEYTCEWANAYTHCWGLSVNYST